jgi:adenylate kinase family enzyme
MIDNASSGHAGRNELRPYGWGENMHDKQRIHIIGAAGSGKTTLARRLGTLLDAPFYDLDEIGYEGGFGAKRSLDMRIADIERIVAQPAWITEGGFIFWIDDLLRAANIIVWLDLPWRIRRWRIITRHIKADLARTNRHPGYLNLYNFYMRSREYHRSKILLTLNPDEGLANDSSNRITVAHKLAPYREKVVQCCSPTDVEKFVAKISVGA